MTTNIRSRRRFLGTVGSASIIGLTGCLSVSSGGDNGGAENYPSNPIQTIIPFSEGGGVDRSVRELQSFFEESIDGQLQLEYRPGGGTQIGQQAVLDANPDCYTVGVASMPAFNFTMITGDADYDLSDFAWIGTKLVDPGVLRKHRDDDRFEDITDVIEYASENPGDLSVSTSGPYNQNVLGLALLQEVTGAEFNIVPYDGGGPSRNALVTREVDLVHANVYNSVNTTDDTEVLAIHAEENNWSELTDNAPTFSDALGFDQEEIPPSGPEVRYAWYTSAEAGDEYSERLSILQESFEESVTSREYEEHLSELSPPQEGKRDFRPPDETEQLAQEKQDQMESHLDTMETVV
ncbi:tripartite tricarboxylate transporter substrate binding protein [Halalkalicoccus sp. NIPERK01]|uniref:Bug family tripartite tricarboxylate transporter substrate binding protein n=1 Tax=Halalkalicoccus sp. NIPERK01 TaxID=3053469 RepID=UPI00256F2797|nr:tripartite tricarboxylate transporter substrate-binding protein [Halalkalicoccus sp. NIPERK01]MDL5363836.1 tripartite tricarboxylate transporter substrate-binding protein [Halalkalicoccus sp. NIPERK01]